jgi:hypothetical protein
MRHDWVLWILVTASALHVVEERGLGWQGWAARTLAPRIGIAPSWLDFWATNGLLVLFGISASAIGWRAPGFSLAYPACCLVNAIFFHLLPSITARRPNPGLFTAVVLYLPVGVWAYVAAGDDGVLSAATGIGSVALGAAAMASVLVLLKLQPRFRYPDLDPSLAGSVGHPPAADRNPSAGTTGPSLAADHLGDPH